MESPFKKQMSSVNKAGKILSVCSLYINVSFNLSMQDLKRKIACGFTADPGLCAREKIAGVTRMSPKFWNADGINPS